jgi:branched-subunit amino acid transport protein AzlD
MSRVNLQLPSGNLHRLTPIWELQKRNEPHFVLVDARQYPIDVFIAGCTQSVVHFYMGHGFALLVALWHKWSR